MYNHNATHFQASRKTRRRPRWAAAALGGLLLAALPATAVGAEVAGGTFTLSAESYAVRLLYNMPHYMVVDPLLQGTWTRAFSMLDHASSLSEASSLDAGPPQYLTEAAPGLFTGQPISGPPWPFLARVRNSGEAAAPAQAGQDGAGVGRAYVSATAEVVTAHSNAYELSLPPGGEKAAGYSDTMHQATDTFRTALAPTFGMQPLAEKEAPPVRVETEAATRLEAPRPGGPAMARSQADLRMIELLGGTVKIAGAHASAESTDPGGQSAGKGTVRLGDVTVAGKPGYIDESGLHIDQTVAGADQLDKALQEALTNAKVTIRRGGVRVVPNPTVDGAALTTASALLVTFQFDLPTVNPDNIVAFTIGHAEASAVFRPTDAAVGSSADTPSEAPGPAALASAPPDPGVGAAPVAERPGHEVVQDAEEPAEAPRLAAERRHGSSELGSVSITPASERRFLDRPRAALVVFAFGALTPLASPGRGMLARVRSSNSRVRP